MKRNSILLQVEVRLQLGQLHWIQQEEEPYIGHMLDKEALSVI